MPMFEFICSQCGHKFEELVFGSYGGLKCPQCGSEDISKQVSAFASSSLASGSSCSTSGSCSKKGFG